MSTAKARDSLPWLAPYDRALAARDVRATAAMCRAYPERVCGALMRFSVLRPPCFLNRTSAATPTNAHGHREKCVCAHVRTINSLFLGDQLCTVHATKSCTRSSAAKAPTRCLVHFYTLLCYYGTLRSELASRPTRTLRTSGARATASTLFRPDWLVANSTPGGYLFFHSET